MTDRRRDDLSGAAEAPDRAGLDWIRLATRPGRTRAARAEYRRAAGTAGELLRVLEETADRNERARLLFELACLETTMADARTAGWSRRPVDDEGRTRADGHRLAARLLAHLARNEVAATGERAEDIRTGDPDDILDVLVAAAVARTRAALLSRQMLTTEAARGASVAEAIESQHFAYTLVALGSMGIRPHEPPVRRSEWSEGKAR